MALDGRIIEIMLQFTPEALSTQFMEQYQFEYGEKKVIEIVRKVEESKNARDYLNNLLSENIKPSAKGLEVLMAAVAAPLQYYRNLAQTLRSSFQDQLASRPQSC